MIDILGCAKNFRKRQENQCNVPEGTLPFVLVAECLHNSAKCWIGR
jgi:hypothetical protein